MLLASQFFKVMFDDSTRHALKLCIEGDKIHPCSEDPVVQLQLNYFCCYQISANGMLKGQVQAGQL